MFPIIHKIRIDAFKWVELQFINPNKYFTKH